MRNTNYLVHFGVKGQKWGLRQWQYKDGSYTSAGRIHYGIGNGNRVKKGAQKSETDNKNKIKRNYTPLKVLGTAAVASALMIYGSKKLVDLHNDKVDSIAARQKTKEILESVKDIPIYKFDLDIDSGNISAKSASYNGVDILKNVQDLLNQQYKDLGF